MAATASAQPENPDKGFNTQPPEGGCARRLRSAPRAAGFQHTATRRWLRSSSRSHLVFGIVSTHSHPKVAAPAALYCRTPHAPFQHTATRRWLQGGFLHVSQFFLRFNTQPPEGGCACSAANSRLSWSFQHTATRRWLPAGGVPAHIGAHVSTHSHPKVAAVLQRQPVLEQVVSTHSHPKVAATCTTFSISPAKFQHTATRRWLRDGDAVCRCRQPVSTHSHPKVAAANIGVRFESKYVSTHSHPKVAAQPCLQRDQSAAFQHTATRRWLPSWQRSAGGFWCFNTQPPEGGCVQAQDTALVVGVSTHSHPKVAASSLTCPSANASVSTHSHPKVATSIGLANKPRPPVSTHSHPKVAARELPQILPLELFQHTATRRWLRGAGYRSGHCRPVSTHSHPKVAAAKFAVQITLHTVSTHSHPKVAASPNARIWRRLRFQHTATRRWLLGFI